MKILINNSVTGTEIFKIQKQPPELLLKVSQNSQESTYARVSDLQLKQDSDTGAFL